MIIVRLFGGLGNQMFQYATARRLAKKHSTLLKLDIGEFKSYKLHKYGLGCFHLTENLATHSEIKFILGSSSFFFMANSDSKLKSLIRRGIRKVCKKFPLDKPWSNRLLIEKSSDFDSNILSAPNNVLLDGYWQSEKYFSDIKDILHHDFSIKYNQSDENRKLGSLIQKTNSISLHVRRGDYVTNAKSNRILGTCGQQYYARSIDYICRYVENPHFFIFSDKPVWVRNNLRIDHSFTIVDCNDASRNYEDLRLMNMCKHNIIANSTFSWWGAWLNSNPDKIVCAPKSWLATPRYSCVDLVPNSWVRL
jgi:hypothetical protein